MCHVTDTLSMCVLSHIPKCYMSHNPHLALEYINNGCEGFPVDDLGIMSKPGDNGGLYVEAWTIDGFASTFDVATLSLSSLDRSEVAIHTLLTVQGAVKSTIWNSEQFGFSKFPSKVQGMKQVVFWVAIRHYKAILGLGQPG